MNLVNHSAQQESEEERRTTAISGQKCFALFPKYGRDGLLARTLRELLTSTTAWCSGKLSLTWKAQDTKARVSLFQLVPSVRRTEGTGFGLLPTPTGQEAEHPQAELTATGRRLSKNNNSHSLNIADRIAMLPTPQLDDAKNTGHNTKRRETLASKVYQMLPSPTTRDYKDGTSTENVPENGLLGRVIPNNGRKTGIPLRLEPAFVEWMMGYPTGWTDLKH